MQAQRLILILLLGMNAAMLFAGVPAQGTVQGKITDAETGEPLIGANIMLNNTMLGASSDMEGNFIIRGVPPGTFDLRVSFIGYVTETIRGVEVRTSEPVKVKVALKPETIQTAEVVISASAVRSAELSVLSERRYAATIGDGISAELIKRSPDATSGDALRRVTGVTLVDNKYVYVRGVTDRYNQTTINGSAVTSTNTDNDKKSFSFDLLPASLLENSIVVKTATPDLPGDFTGGLVQLNTIDMPFKRVTKFGFSASSNTLTSYRDVYASKGGATDWLGFDDGTRALPAAEFDPYETGKQLPQTWAAQRKKAPMNMSANIALGDRYQVLGSELGVVGAFTYRNGFQRTENSITQTRDQVPILTLTGTRDQYSVLWGGIFDATLRLGPASKISFKNNINRSAEDRVSRNTGMDENQNELRTQTIQWSERSFYLGQLSGEHSVDLFEGGVLEWKMFLSNSSALEPDRRSSKYTRPFIEGMPDDQNPYIETQSERSWSNTYERSRGFGADYRQQFGFGSLKAGFTTETRNRQYDITFYLLELENLMNGQLRIQPLEQIFAPENFGPGKYRVQKLSTPADKYAARQQVTSGYAMADIPFELWTEKFRFVGGARVEKADLNVETTPTSASEQVITAGGTNVDILPSFNITYMPNPAANIRLAYYHSVNRPELRELASTYYYDFNMYEGVYGNPQLRRATVKNYDVRVEIFPELGEVLAVSYFRKVISDAIEQRLIWSSNPERTWFNSSEAVNYGWEAEMRKNLGFIGRFMSGFELTANYTRIFSRVAYDDPYVSVENGSTKIVQRTSYREMQGQSPYTLNVSLIYTAQPLGTSFSVMYNEFGTRLDAVGDVKEDDILENAYGTLDVGITQSITNNVELKMTAKDIGAKPRTYSLRTGETYRTLFRGTTYSLALSLNL